MESWRQQLEQRLRRTRRSYPSPPAPVTGSDVEALRQQVRVLEEQIEIMLGRRGDVLDQHVAVRDLINLGLITQRGSKQ